MMLDLTTAFQTAPYQIKLFDGSILNLKRPTQALYQTLMDVLPMIEDKDQSKLLPIMIDIFTRILNRNDEGKTFTKDEIEEEFDLMIVVYVVKDYFQYWTKEIADHVNFQITQ